MGELAIRVEGLSKQYRIGGAQASYQTLRESLVNATSAPLRWLRGDRQEQNSIWALDDVSFEVKRGEAVGIIGRNGAGKSTLLKILSRITRPTGGRVDLYGRVGSLLEVGTGFHPELTGRENIFLNGAILGMTRREIQRKFDEIVDFAEIEQFLDTPVKHYSSGMYVRLAFAVAAHLEPEILLVDEVLAVGDIQFQQKCLGKMDDVAKQGRTVLFVSHNMAAIKQLCITGILLESGRVSTYGQVEKVVSSYLNLADSRKKAFAQIPEDLHLPVQLETVSIRDEHHNIFSVINHDSPFYVEVLISLRKEIKNLYVALHIHDNELNSLIFMRDFETNENLLLKRERGQYKYRFHVPAPLLVPGNYSVSVHAVILGEGKVSALDYGCPFEIVDAGSEWAQKGYPWIRKINAPIALDIFHTE